MTDLAEKYINDHRNPIVKAELFGYKLFLPLQDNGASSSNTCLSKIEKILRQDRVNRRCARNAAKWTLEENALVTKRVGCCLASYGYQNKNGKFLRPEEILVLLESNKLEIFYNDIPLSIHEAYKILLKNLKPGFKKYISYKKLTLQGYRLKAFKSESEENGGEIKKRKLSQERMIEEPATKISKLTDSEVSKIFKQLRENGPKLYQSQESTTKPEYVVSYPSNLKNNSEEFGLIIKSVTAEFSSNEDYESNIHALCSHNDVAYYRFFNSNIPIL